MTLEERLARLEARVLAQADAIQQQRAQIDRMTDDVEMYLRRLERALTYMERTRTGKDERVM